MNHTDKSQITLVQISREKVKADNSHKYLIKTSRLKPPFQNADPLIVHL